MKKIIYNVIICMLIVNVGILTAYSKDISVNRVPEEKTEFLSKLSYGMTDREIIEAVGKPNISPVSAYPVYRFVGEDAAFELKLRSYEDSLMAVESQDGINLLAKEWKAEEATFEVNVNGKEVIIGNPLVTINDKLYVPLEELQSQLGIQVLLWNQEERCVDIRNTMGRFEMIP